MRITFVTPTPLDLSAFGVRSLSSFLKRAGFDVRNLFLPGGIAKYRHQEQYSYRYEPKVLSEVTELCADSDLIGISFMSNYYERAIQLTSAIKSKLDTPVIWGGIHPTVMPEESLRYADLVCVGEGEYALRELLCKMREGRSLEDIENIWTKKDGKIIRNPLRPLEKDLDKFPFFDFGFDDHYVYDIRERSIVPMTKERLRLSFLLEPHFEDSFIDSFRRTRNYKTMTTRGCPHSCTYCAENTLAAMYKGQRYLRKRSISHVISELEAVRENLPFVESIFLFDDTFMIRSTQEIREFARQYKERIGLPFLIQASPSTLTEERIQLLINAGLCFVEMGIQTASDKGKKIYHRNISDERLLKAAAILHKYQGRLYPPRYHLILDNPWETREDVMQTLNLVQKLPKPFAFCKSSLTFFPGTPLYQKAREEGIIRDDKDLWRLVFNKHFEQPKGNYMNFLIFLTGFCGFPRPVIKFLSRERIAALLDKESLSNVYTALFKLGSISIVIYKGIRSLIKGDFKRIGCYITRVYSHMS